MAGGSTGKPRPYRLQAPVVREHPMQQAVAKLLAIELAPAGKISEHGVVWFCVDIASYGGKVPGIRLSRGIIAGVPDLFLLWGGRAYLVELKAADGGLSEPQKAFLAAAIAGCVHVGVACSAEDVLGLLDAWGIPRNKRVRVAA